MGTSSISSGSGGGGYTSSIQTPTVKHALPDSLKSGVESLSGHSIDDVKVHYNSSKPSQLQAGAYAQGSDIHIGPGQEKTLAHEASHIVRQGQPAINPDKRSQL